MFIKNGIWVYAIGIILTVVCASACAQQKVYKWVDEEGVVHFSEEPPDNSPKDEVETFTTDPARHMCPLLRRPPNRLRLLKPMSKSNQRSPRSRHVR